MEIATFLSPTSVTASGIGGGVRDALESILTLDGRCLVLPRQTQQRLVTGRLPVWQI